MMEDKFLMGRSDPLIRHKASEIKDTELNSSLAADLTKLPIREASSFYSGFFNIDVHNAEIDKFAKRYSEHQADATKLGLFKAGGIRHKDHLNFWCLSNILRPTTYIE